MWSNLTDTFCHVISSPFSSQPEGVVFLCAVCSDSSIAFMDARNLMTGGVGWTSTLLVWIRWTAFPFLQRQKVKRFCTDSGGVPSIKNTFSTKILANSTKDMMIIVACKPIPSIGTPSEVSGRNDGIRSKNTIIASRMVVTNPTLSPLSTGIKKLVSASIMSKLLGNVR